MSDTQQGPDWWLASDGKWYPPQKPPPPVWPKPVKKPSARRSLLIFVGVVLFCVLFLPSVIDGFNDAGNPAADDVEILTCSTGVNLVDIQVEITNPSSKMSNYSIEMNLLDSSGNKVGDASGYATNIGPGQKATEKLLGVAPADFDECEIVNVRRSAS